MSELSRDELLAEMAAMQARMAEMERQLATQQSGSGATAQSGGTAAGAAGVAVGGDVHGNVYVGERPADEATALAIYRRIFVSSARALPLRGVDIHASDPSGEHKAVDLDAVYVGLNTTSQRRMSAAEQEAAKKSNAGWDEPEKMTPIPALEALLGQRQMVLLGDPGSGKSTFLTHLGLCLALHGLEPEGNWLTHLPGWPDGEADLLPVAVVLRDFARSLAGGKPGQATPQLLWNFISTRLAEQNLDFAAQPLHDALEAGRAILLLDGLDEIPAASERTFIRDSIAAFLKRYPTCRAVVTCRTLSYQNPAWQLAGLPAFTLAPFDEQQIHDFVRAWYGGLAQTGQVTGEEASVLTQRLVEAVQRPDLRGLAPNPLLLTVMALVHTHKGRLPDARALLYEETVEILLWRWEQKKSGAGEEMPRLRGLLVEAGRGDVDLKRVLWRLAFVAHGSSGSGTGDSGAGDSGAGDSGAGGEGLADIGELALQKALAGLHPAGSLDWANSLIQTMKLRAGLLLEREPSLFRFPHRTFQEYLAGAHLAAQPDFARQARLLTERWDIWRQAILLGVGRLVYLGGDTAKPLALVAALCPRQADADDLAWRRAWLAGEALLEMGLNRVQEEELGRELLERVQDRLVELLQSGNLTPVERAEAGDVLAGLGDHRFRADAWALPADLLLGFVEIAAGPFVMGSDKRKNPQAQEREMPQHRLDLPAFWMARYPVTVAQWRAFVQASDHTPEIRQSLADPANRPVRYVTWHEAIAYCRWLTETLRGWSGTPPALAELLAAGWEITLPSEAEWEKGARGGAEMPNPDRLYPWGDEADSDRANYSATGIGDTSAVGCFPAGASPYGLEELAGNVWEWTRSLWGENWQNPTFVYPYRGDDGREQLDASDQVLRVLRGGAFYSDANRIPASARYGHDPSYGYFVMGFRLVLVPSSRVAGSGF